MQKSDFKSIKILLLIIALPVLFYILKVLSFIFIPLLFAMFIALLFLPLMRKLRKKNIPKSISLAIAVLISIVFITLVNQIIQFSARELLASDTNIFTDIELKLKEVIVTIEQALGFERINGESIGEHYIQKLDLNNRIKSIIEYFGSAISMTLTTLFFTILLLAGSLDFKKILNSTIIKSNTASIKVFRRIEKSIITFIKVKFLVSLFTGVGFSLACYFFNVDFPVFWGVLAFFLNFIQMIGSFIALILLSLFAISEIETQQVLLFFIFTITAVQVMFGSIIEPIFMGKSFSINIMTILVMLMFWGFIWGIPGMILAVPLTLSTKILLEQFTRTKVIAGLMSGK